MCEINVESDFSVYIYKNLIFHILLKVGFYFGRLRSTGVILLSIECYYLIIGAYLDKNSNFMSIYLLILGLSINLRPS